MSTRQADDRDDDLLERAGRWVFAKVWFGCLLSGGYALSRSVEWPAALVSVFAALGALGLAVAATWLPIWTREYSVGVAPVDVGVKVVIWVGLAAAVISLLIGTPAVGTVAGALFLTTAWRTYRPSAQDAPSRGRIGALRR